MQGVRHMLNHCKKKQKDDGKIQWDAQLWLLKKKNSFFVNSGFKVEDMALMLGCSKRTVERRLSTYNLSTRNHTVITDHELDELVQELFAVFPRCGEKLVHGRLQAHGVHVQRRVRESIHRVDPSGVQA